MKIFHIVISKEPSDHLFELCRHLLYKQDVVALHIDLKFGNYGLPDDLLLNPRLVEVMPRIKVYHGDYSIVKATLHAYHFCAPLLDDCDYINLLSGEDFPTRPTKDLHTFLLQNPDMDFINSVPIPVQQNVYHEGVLNEEFKKTCKWFLNEFPIYFYDRINPQNYFESIGRPSILKRRSYAFEKRPQIQFILSYLTKFRTFNRLLAVVWDKRRFLKIKFYGGSAWYTVRKQTMHKVLEFIQSSQNRKTVRFIEKMKYPDEFYMPTILNLVGSQNVVDSDLRYLDWGKADFYGRPAFITKEEIHKIEKSNAFFCRKVNNQGRKLILENIHWKKK